MNKELQETVKGHLIRWGTREVMRYLLKEIPFLSWGPLSTLSGFIVKRVLVILIEKTHLGMKLIKIHLEVAKDVKEVRDILDKIHALPEGEYDAELDEELAKAGRDLIRLGSN